MPNKIRTAGFSKQPVKLYTLPVGSVICRPEDDNCVAYILIDRSGYRVIDLSTGQKFLFSCWDAVIPLDYVAIART
jgi:hypothetical protein